MATTWEDEEETARDPLDWDLEDALARAILGDAEDLRDIPKPSAFASTATLRDDAEEERLIERLHARLFPSTAVPASMKPHQAKQKQQKTRVAKSPTVRQAKPTTTSVPAQPRRSISPEKINQMIERFRLHEAKRSRKLSMLTQQSSVSSITSSASSDLVSPRSRELTRNFPSFQQRQAIAMANRERELERQRQRTETLERGMCESLSTVVRSPCICGSAGGSRVLSEPHSPACTRFMEACEKMNATSDIKRKKQHMRRTVDDMMRFHEESKRKQAEMAEIQRVREQQEATFAPRINRNSIKIYEEMMESGRLKERVSGRSSSPPLRPFQPTLCAKSKIVLANSRRRSSITSRGSVASKGSILPSRRRPSHSLIPKPSSFSESHWARRSATTPRKDSPPATPQPPPFLVPWTTVPFASATCDFILTNFDQPAWFR